MHESRTLPKDLVTMNQAMMDLPPQWRRHLLPAMDGLVESSMRRKRILHLIQENLETIKADVAYLRFDLLCTRQERDSK